MAEQNSYDFWTRYSNLCLKCKVCPLKSVIKHMKGTTLCCPVERIRSEHWQFLLSALSVDNSLTEVCFKSLLPPLEEQKELWKKRRRKLNEKYPIPYGYSPENISDICKYSTHLLTVSQTLQVLIVENLPITKEDAEHLAEGLKSTSVKEFAFRSYPYSNDVIEIVCRGLWDSKVDLLDFSACNLSLVGLKFICNLIEKHKNKRTIEVFPGTLRLNLPLFEEMTGLKRVNLNGNNLGDKGAEVLCDTVSYDSWIRALDLQCCGITNDGAISFLKVVTANNSIQLVDLRLNDIDSYILERISLQLSLNSHGKSMNYACLPLWKPRLLNKSLPVRKNKLKTKVMKKYSKTSPFKKETRGGFEHAFRISYEIVDNKDVGSEDAAVQTNARSDFINLQEKIKSLEKRLCREMQMRDSLMDLMDKLKIENSNLRQEVIKMSTYNDVILIDQDTYGEIKHVFEKFQRFLQLMKEYGLWELASAIGVAEYENTNLHAVVSESKVCVVDKEVISADDHLTNGPVNPPISKPQTRCCSCLQPECISNQKAEKENSTSNFNHIPKKSDKSQLKNIVDKAKITFKELRETYTNSEVSKQQLPTRPPFTRKFSTGDLITGKKHAKPFKSVSNSDIPSKFKHIKTCQDLCAAMKVELEKPGGGCLYHNISQSPARGKFLDFYQNILKNKSSLKNVSSQTVTVDSISNSKRKKVNPASLSGSALSQKSGHVVNNSPSLITSHSSEQYAQQAVRKVSLEWEEHVKKNFPEIASHSKTTSNVESSASPIVDPGYFKASKVQSKQGSVESEMSQYSSKINASRQNIKETRSVSNPTAHSTSVNSINSADKKAIQSSSVLHSANEQVFKSSSSQTSDKNNSIKSYLESVSDASTDKDVKSITQTEVYESAKSNSVSSKNSNKSKGQKGSISGGGGKSSAINSALSDNSSKSSKKNQKQRKNSNQNSTGGGKIPRDKASSSSVPSLSDITTVSSHSLNTDSVMDQLSESGKGLS